jgi:D-3-phosphoglycerate dehydrogenase
MAMKVLIPQMVAQEAIELLTEHGYEIKYGSGETEEDLIRDVTDCDAILLRTAPCTSDVLSSGKKLKIVARHGAGYNNVDLSAAEKLGIWVTNTPDATTYSVAEFTIGAIISAAKRVYPASRAAREGDFYFKNSHKGMDLKGSTLGIIGFGRIGAEVARKAHFGLDMNVVTYVRSKRKLPDHVRTVDLKTLYAESDFISLHVPATPDTADMVGREAFSLMKDTAYLINCARGEVVDEEELIKALRDKEIAGAFLDVMKKEPFDVTGPLFSMENVTITPHMASNTHECMKAMACQAAGQIHLVLSGEQPTWPVNKPKF